MVGTGHSGLIDMMRWGGFLALSLLLNFYVLSMIKISAPVIEIRAPEKLRLAFTSLAAAKATASAAINRPEKMEKPVQEKEKIAPAVLPEKTVSTSRAVTKAPDRIKPVQTAKKKIVKRQAVIPTPRLLVRKSVKKETVKVAEQRVPTRQQEAIEKPQRTPSKTTAQRPDKTVKKRPPQVSRQSVADNRGRQLSTVIHKARYRDRTPPAYPRRAYELGQQGLVLLHALIAENGQPATLRIKSSSGHRMLDRAAVAAVKKWEFEPHILNGKRIQSWVSVPVRFVIQ